MSRRIFANPDGKEEILNECPLCGSELEYLALGQYSEVFRILKNGKLSKLRKYKRDEGSMDCGFIACSNKNCDFHTDCDLDTDNTGEFQNLYIHQNNEGQFMIEKEV